jgi:hypothetical protein
MQGMLIKLVYPQVKKLLNCTMFIFQSLSNNGFFSEDGEKKKLNMIRLAAIFCQRSLNICILIQ